MEAGCDTEPFELLVRSPTQRHPDLRLRGEPGWTVRQLKARLRRLHPEEPPEEDQKLIYSGKLLLDHLYLRDVLPKEKLHALHLVYHSKNLSKMQETSAKCPEALFWTGAPLSKIDETKQQPKAVLGPSQDPSVVSSSDGLRQRETSCNQLSTVEPNTRVEVAQHPLHGVASGFSAYTTYNILQMSWFQQIYARQYYMQYLAAASADRSPTQRSQEIPVAPVAAPAPLPNPFPAQNQPGNHNAPPQLNAGANQNLQMNAQGGPLMEGEEEMNRDWLDWLYSATLFFVFVNIIYFYSSLSRFIMVMGGTVLMYLHHVGWFPFRRLPVHPLPNNILPHAVVNQDQNNNLQQEENAGGEGEPEVVPDEGRALPESQQGSPSFMNTAWLFFKTFFASLLPEGPPAAVN
ncbi:homocysteine-responsive endoplasmic reticulum-resident ubiquitin-like domain member 1 protein isoform X2 [Emydura macquarii macquarii]|uniref:homocysteine-responsive endoplasmic reticulum-resident ubiquitin-like domain member 1 protein isoform X2 n=1 Tax=Emydura macquarii macquarii TaxID=1129001 RepID=UPI00352A7AA4